jgi:hypothetical protein
MIDAHQTTKFIKPSPKFRRMKADNKREDFFKSLLKEENNNVSEALLMSHANTLM